MKDHEAGNGERESRDASWEKQQREEIRRLSDDPTNFLGDGPPSHPLEGARWSKRSTVTQVTSEVATFYVLIPADAPREWWTDARIEVGTCPFHHHPPGLSVDDNPCPYQACSVLIARDPDLLYRAAWSELLSASPDLPREALWRDLLANWRPVKVDLSLVRVAWLQDQPSLKGGEPEVRRSGRALRSGEEYMVWDHLRDVVRVHFASLAVLWGDPMGLNQAAKLIIFKAPFQALWRAGAIRDTPVDLNDVRIRRLPSPRPANALLSIKLLAWPPGRSRVGGSLNFRVRVWRANRRQAAKERRARRQARRTARREIMRRELALDEPDPEVRARTRTTLIGTVREAIGLLGDIAETLRRAFWPALVVTPGAIILLLRYLIG